MDTQYPKREREREERTKRGDIPKMAMEIRRE